MNVSQKNCIASIDDAAPHLNASHAPAQTSPAQGMGHVLCHSDRFLGKAEEASRQVLRSWCDYGPKQINVIDPDMMPGIFPEVAKGILDAMLNHGAKDFAGVYVYFMDAPQSIRDELCESNQGYSPRPQDCGSLLEIIRRYDAERKRDHLAGKLRMALERGEDSAEIMREFAALEAGHPGQTHSMIVAGVNSYPTETPQETVLLGNGWLRRGDIATFISTAGAGKSVASIQSAMAWGLGLPYLGIHPPRPLRILLFSGEDDGVTMGQCREGFLEHSAAITGRQLRAQDLAPLDTMLRTEFCREYVGERFHGHLAKLLRESPADLVIVNPLLSYVGGEVVACASEWLRAGLMPVLQQFDCAALLAHHTGKMAKDGWDNTDDTYSAIGGSELANIPRAILTLRPTTADGLSVVKVSKRQTTGWRDAQGNYCASYFVKRTNDPTKPAWLPVDSDEAGELIDASKATASPGRGKKVSAIDVVAAVETGAMHRQTLIEWLMRKCSCSDRPARHAINEAIELDLITSYTEPNPHGGKPLKWFCLPAHNA